MSVPRTLVEVRGCGNSEQNNQFVKLIAKAFDGSITNYDIQILPGGTWRKTAKGGGWQSEPTIRVIFRFNPQCGAPRPGYLTDGEKAREMAADYAKTLKGILDKDTKSDLTVESGFIECQGVIERQ